LIVKGNYYLNPAGASPGKKNGTINWPVIKEGSGHKEATLATRLWIAFVMPPIINASRDNYLFEFWLNLDLSAWTVLRQICVITDQNLTSKYLFSVRLPFSFLIYRYCCRGQVKRVNALAWVTPATPRITCQ